MKRTFENPKDIDDRESGNQTGYTFIEILGVTALIVMVVLMTQGMMRNYKRYTVEETAVQRLMELSRLENAFRYSNDPTVNPEQTYGTYFDLQNAGLVSEIYEQSDERRHTVNAFVPYYRLEFVKNNDTDDLEPDGYQYLIRAVPLYNPYNLKTFYVQEDGEVYYERGFFKTPR